MTEANDRQLPNQPEATGEQQGRDRRGRFPPGCSGNPAGRPKGARGRAALLAENLLLDEGEAIIRKLIDLALQGNMAALRLCVERLIPPARERPVALDLGLHRPSDTRTAMTKIADALACGDLTPRELAALTAFVAIYLDRFRDWESACRLEPWGGGAP